MCNITVSHYWKKVKLEIMKYISERSFFKFQWAIIICATASQYKYKTNLYYIYMYITCAIVYLLYYIIFIAIFSTYINYASNVLTLSQRQIFHELFTKRLYWLGYVYIDSVARYILTMYYI